MEFGEMKRNTSNWSNFCMLLLRARLSALAGLSCLCLFSLWLTFCLDPNCIFMSRSLRSQYFVWIGHWVERICRVNCIVVMVRSGAERKTAWGGGERARRNPLNDCREQTSRRPTGRQTAWPEHSVPQRSSGSDRLQPETTQPPGEWAATTGRQAEGSRAGISTQDRPPAW